jgi:glycosyltransferase involved in cell wall biosynthesis
MLKSSCAKRPVILVLGPDRMAVSGVSTHVSMLCTSALTSQFELSHFAVGSEGRNESPLSRLARLVTSPLTLAFAIVRRDVSIVHVNTSLNARAYWRDLVYTAVGKMFGADVVYQVHGGVLPDRFVRGNRVAAAFLRATLRLPDAIVVLAQHQLQAYRTFVPAQRIVMVPNAIDASAFVAMRRTRSGAAGELRLAYFGRLVREKGLYELLEGFRLARLEGVAARLVIAGSGPEDAALRRWVDDAALAEHVALPGPLFGEGKFAMLAETDVFVLPTYHAEGLPYSLLEAMAAGIPVITTSVAGIPDVVRDGVHGLFVPPRDPQALCRAIRLLATQQQLLDPMSAACRSRIIDGYSLARLAESFGKLYQRVLGTTRTEVWEKI